MIFVTFEWGRTIDPPLPPLRKWEMIDISMTIFAYQSLLLPLNPTDGILRSIVKTLKGTNLS